MGKGHDFHPFDHGPEQPHGTKRKWSEEREPRPKLLLKEKEWRKSAALQEDVEESQTPGSERRRNSMSSEPPAGDSTAQVSLVSHPKSEEEMEQERQSPPVAAMRAQPKKIMLRKMSDGSKSDTNEGPEKESGRAGDRTADSKSAVRKTAGEQDSSDAAGNTSKTRPTAWKTNERGGGPASKTLYEPEGKKSEAKFRKYQHDARVGGGGKRERGGPSPVTTPSEPNPPASSPDTPGREKVAMKRTFSGEKGRKARGGGDKIAEEDNLKWAEPPRNQRDRPDDGHRDHSTPPNEAAKEQPKAPAQTQREQQEVRGTEREGGRGGGRQEGRGGGRRERGSRADRRIRGSETDEMREEGRSSKSRTGSDSDCRSWQRDDGPPSPHQRRPRGSRGEPRGPRAHRLPSRESSKEERLQSREERAPLREDKLPPKEDKQPPKSKPPRVSEPHQREVEEREVKRKETRPSGGAGVSPASVAATEKTSVSTAHTRTVVPTTTTTMTTVSMAPASVPQSVINKSVSVQTMNLPLPIGLPLATPTRPPLAPPTQLPQQSVRKPLLDDPPLPLRQDPLALSGRQGPLGGGRHETSDNRRRAADSADGRRKQPSERRREGGEAGRGGRRGTQKGRGERSERCDQPEWQESKQSSSRTAAGAEVEGEQGKRKEERGRGRGGRGGRDRRPGSSSEEKKPAQPEGEGGRRGDGGGRGRDRRRNRGRKAESSQTDGSERPHRRHKDSGRLPAGEHRGGGRERPNKSSSAAEEKKGINLAMGYGSLEDIDSDSDWGEESKEVRGGGKVGETKRVAGEMAAPREPPKGRGRGQQRSHDVGEQQRSSGRGGAGKGRGRGRSSGERERGRPGGARQDHTTDTRVQKSEPSTAAPDESSSEKPADVHKQQDFAKYDLNSSTIAIVDDIGGQPEEVEGTVEFVEVTSKKAQKEKVKKEREEQWRQQSLATDLRDDQRRNRKSVTAKSSEQTALPINPSMAWSSKDDQSNIWSASPATSASDWGIIHHSTSAPGAELKEQAGGWVAASASVGVIGDTLQARNISTSLAGQTEHLPTTSGYSLFPDYSSLSLLHHTQYAGGGSMLNAAVNMKLSQEHISSPSGEPAALGGQLQEAKESAALLKKEIGLPQRKSQVVQPPSSTKEASRETSVSAAAAVSSEPSGGGSRSGSDLPPRLQSGRSGSGRVGRGRGGGRGRRTERGRRGGSGERRGQQDVPGEGKRESQPTREHTTKDKVKYFTWLIAAIIVSKTKRKFFSHCSLSV